MSSKKYTLFGTMVMLFLLSVSVAYASHITADGLINEGAWSNNSTICYNDADGPNDSPGQKDITRVCANDEDFPNTVHVYWNWDETGLTGTNTADACALFDSDGDGNTNYAVCVTANGNPLTHNATRVFECVDDDEATSCSGATLVSNSATTCGVAQNANDPFPAGAASPNDTTAECAIAVADIGGSMVEMTNVCASPSPNASASDCLNFGGSVPLAIHLQTLDAMAVLPAAEGLLIALGVALIGLSLYLMRSYARR